MERIKINEQWKVWEDTDPFELVFKVPDDAKDVDLPYDAMFHEKQNPDSINGGSNGYLDGKEYKYYKQLFISDDNKGKQLGLLFEGIYRHALVFVNQSKVGEIQYGYSEVYMDITDYIQYGKSNDILVVVKTGTKNSRWYSGAGIYRDVYLYIGEYVYVKPYGLKVSTLNVENEEAAIEVKAMIHNDTNIADTFNINIEIYQEDQAKVISQTFLVRIKRNSTFDFYKSFFIEHALLWDDEHPHLYTAILTISRDEAILDKTKTVFGIRKITIDAKHGLRINGREVKLRGACIHHDANLLGACAYDDYEYLRIGKLKQAGFNAIRSAHNHASQAMLRACDLQGMYVMDELVDVWNKSKVSYDYSLDFDQNYEIDIERMVDADYNHPSVILYSTGNEIFEINTEKGFETAKKLSDKFHELDATRYTTNGINGAFAAGEELRQIVDDITGGTADTSSGDVNVFMSIMEKDMPAIVSHPVLGKILEKLETSMDIMGYNYMTSRYLMDAKSYPDRIMVGSETYPKQIAENWDTITQCSQVIGDFTWTGYDYMGEISKPYPRLFNDSGDLSITGVRRPISYYREIVYGLTSTPCIAVQDPKRYGTPRNYGPWKYTDCTFNYNYPDSIGKPIMIQVYGNGDTVELFLNGKSLGLHPCGRDTKYETQYNTNYQPGELKAISYLDGKEIGTTTLLTSGAITSLRITTESSNSLHLVNIDTIDDQGNIVYSSIPLNITIEGDATLLAFGSDQAIHDCGFEKPTTTTTDGHALAIIKAGTKDSIITITSESLSASIQI